MPITSALDQENTRIPAKKAIKGLFYQCEFCGTRMFARTSRKDFSYYVCREGEEHTHPVCRDLVRRKKAYSEEKTDGMDFITSLMVPDREGKKAASGSPKTTNVSAPEDDSVFSEVKYSSLQALWVNQATYLWGADTKIGNGKASDHFMFFPWFNLLSQFKGGYYVIQTRGAVWSSGAEKLICTTKVGKWNTPDYKEFKFVAQIPRSLQRPVLSKLFDSDHENGIFIDRPNFEWLLIAGAWEKKTYRGQDQWECVIYSEKQIYGGQHIDPPFGRKN